MAGAPAITCPILPPLFPNCGIPAARSTRAQNGKMTQEKAILGKLRLAR
jgi:hypothetical protein